MNMGGESMKNKLFVLIAVILFLGCCIGVAYYMENYESVYYTKIDNAKVKRLSTSDPMKYEYSLESYSRKGIKKTLKFKTSRELREEAYIQLEVRIFGVHKWEEIQFTNLPEKVQQKLK